MKLENYCTLKKAYLKHLCIWMYKPSSLTACRAFYCLSFWVTCDLLATDSVCAKLILKI